MIRAGYNVKCTDIIDRGFGIGGVDFLKENEPFNGDIVKNYLRISIGTDEEMRVVIDTLEKILGEFENA